jgi:hypothetical protein
MGARAMEPSVVAFSDSLVMRYSSGSGDGLHVGNSLEVAFLQQGQKCLRGPMHAHYIDSEALMESFPTQTVRVSQRWWAFQRPSAANDNELTLKRHLRKAYWQIPALLIKTSSPLSPCMKLRICICLADGSLIRDIQPDNPDSIRVLMRNFVQGGWRCLLTAAMILLTSELG